MAKTETMTKLPEPVGQTAGGQTAGGQTAEPNGAVAFLEALARDVALVLKSLGGSAHQNVVIDCVAAIKRQRGEPVTQDLRAAVVEVFNRYSQWFTRPFGEGSMRWALVAEPA